ncbi:MAG: 4-phosphoerythronate dehydrogenase [Balneolaceae bacterium]
MAVPTVLANRHLYRLNEALPPPIRADRFDPVRFPSDAPRYNALLINTTTRIDATTLPERGNLSFIATGSAGSDHVDKHHLEQLGIAFADAAGCNARAVAEYVAVAILLYCDDRQLEPSDVTVGIVGCGHTGGAVHTLLSSLGMATVLYDPPRAAVDDTFHSADKEALYQCDVLTFHVPLTDGGAHPTRHLYDRKWAQRSRHKLLINASRGGVVEERALLDALERGRLDAYVLDVWEREPGFNDRVAEHAFLATPHIAGYSKQAKWRASRMIADALCSHFGLPPHTPPTPFEASAADVSSCRSLSEVLLKLHPIGEYDRRMRRLMDTTSQRKNDGFYALRTNMPLRDEFSFITISRQTNEYHALLARLGIHST